MRFQSHPDEIASLFPVFRSTLVLVSLYAESRQFSLMTPASGDFDRDLSPHPGRLVQLPTEEDIQYLVTFLLTGYRKNGHHVRYYQ
jgi:hypothetical protein